MFIGARTVDTAEPLRLERWPWWASMWHWKANVVQSTDKNILLLTTVLMESSVKILQGENNGKAQLLTKPRSNVADSSRWYTALAGIGLAHYVSCYQSNQEWDFFLPEKLVSCIETALGRKRRTSRGASRCIMITDPTTPNVTCCHLYAKHSSMHILFHNN